MNTNNASVPAPLRTQFRDQELASPLIRDERVGELVERAFSMVRQGIEGADRVVQGYSFDATKAACPASQEQMMFTGTDLQRLGNGFLSNLVENLKISSIEDVVHVIMEARSPSTVLDTSDDMTTHIMLYPPGDPDGPLVAHLLREILISIKENRPIAFNRDDLKQIHLVFALIDYLGLDELQDNQLEPFQARFPDIVDPMQFPSTIHCLTYNHQSDYRWVFSRAERDLLSRNPKALSLSDRFPALKQVKVQGDIPDRFLTLLPNHLLSLDLTDCERIGGRGVNGMSLSTELALMLVAQDGCQLSRLSLELKGNKAVALKAVTQNGQAFQYVSYELRADKEVLLKAIETDPGIVHLAPEALQADPEVVLAVADQHRAASQAILEAFQSAPHEEADRLALAALLNLL